MIQLYHSLAYMQKIQYPTTEILSCGCCYSCSNTQETDITLMSLN